MMTKKWILVFLCCCCSLSSESNSTTKFDDSSEEDEVFNVVTKEILITHQRMSQFAERHADIYIELQRRKMFTEVDETTREQERISKPGFEKTTNLIVPLKSIYSSKPKYNQCQWDFIYIIKSLKTPWVIKMLDSFGKLPSGLLDGQIKWVGSYDECLNVVAPLSQYSQQGFRGRYAWLSFKVSSSDSPLASIAGALQIGVCLPSSCAVDNKLEEFYEFLISILEIAPFVKKMVEKLPNPKIQFVPGSAPLSSASKACISICGIIILFVIMGTLLDALKRKKLIAQPPLAQPPQSPSTKKFDEGEPSNGMMNNSINVNSEEQANGDDVRVIIDSPNNASIEKLKCMVMDFFLCFSAISNGMAILDTSTGQGQLLCLHGIRFFSMAWVMLGHTYYFGAGSFGNMKTVLNILETWPFQVIMQATVSVDTFFLLSGCLLTYLFLKTENQLKSVPQWIMFYVHRYVRLTPVYALMIFIFGTWWNDMTNGPFWSLANRDICANSWWWNILYINNFITAPKMCMAWSWYLANDMQFFIISPLFLIALRRNRKLGLAVVGFLLFVSWLVTGVLNRVQHWNLLFENLGASTTDQMKVFDELYDKPYTRIGPYLIGVLLGYVLIELKDQRSFMNKGLVVLCWVSSQCVSLILLYGMLNANLGPITISAYNTLSRSAWSISVGWVIFACLTGHAGPVNTILSWKMLVPLSRLTYCAYLVHPMVMDWYYNSMKTMIFFTNSTIVINYLAFVVLSYGLAFIISVLFEAPVIKLEKLLRKKS